MKGLCYQAGVKYLRYHALRHAGASALDSLGVPVATIQKLLGHENRTTTEIYLHSIGRNEYEAIQFLGQVGASFEQKSHTKSHTKKNKRLRLVT
jgi:integrase